MLTGQKGRGVEILAYLRAPLHKKRGLTLAELLIVGLILSVILPALFFSLTSSDYSSSVSSAKVDLQGRVRLIMDWIVKDVRQTNLIQINSNDPSPDHIKFKKVMGIDNATGNYTLNPNYTEYDYNSTSATLTRSEINGTTGSVLRSTVFDNITQSLFYTDIGVPLAVGGILTSKKLIVVIAGQNQVRNALTLNLTFCEEVKIRNE